MTETKKDKFYRLWMRSTLIVAAKEAFQSEVIDTDMLWAAMDDAMLDHKNPENVSSFKSEWVIERIAMWKDEVVVQNLAPFDAND